MSKLGPKELLSFKIKEWKGVFQAEKIYVKIQEKRKDQKEAQFTE